MNNTMNQIAQLSKELAQARTEEEREILEAKIFDLEEELEEEQTKANKRYDDEEY